MNTIQRLANNSFLVKGWAITISSLLFGFLATNDLDSLTTATAFLPVLAFWFLDGYFLYQEKLFRSLYDHVRVKSEDQIDFAMNPRIFQKDLRRLFFNALFSKTQIALYGSIAALLLAGIALLS